MIIAVDFDGTIVTHEYPAIGREIPGAIPSLLRLQDLGHKLILWTVREGALLNDAVEFCRSRGLEFYAVNENYEGEQRSDSDPFTACRKLTADIYIDDRNLGGFPGWDAIFRMITLRQSYSRFFQAQIQAQEPSRSSWFARLLGR